MQNPEYTQKLNKTACKREGITASYTNKQKAAKYIRTIPIPEIPEQANAVCINFEDRSNKE